VTSSPPSNKTNCHSVWRNNKKQAGKRREKGEAKGEGIRAKGEGREVKGEGIRAKGEGKRIQYK